jgi:hypothetical protein
LRCNPTPKNWQPPGSTFLFCIVAMNLESAFAADDSSGHHSSCTTTLVGDTRLSPARANWSGFQPRNKEFAAHDGYIFRDEHEKCYLRLGVGVEFLALDT